MTSLSDTKADQFRLSMLLYDRRYRSMTIQIVALIGFLALLGFLVYNAAVNLARLDKELGFGFLWDSAGYDINQRLIDYTSQSTHLRAAAVGLLNTLLVAAMGCVTATILGVLIGVGRLSKNWLISRLCTIYVEMFRNVPVLLWIVFSMAIFIESLPQPRDFRGENATASMFLNDSVAFTNRGWYIPQPVFEAGSNLLVMVFLASIVGMFAFRFLARRLQYATGMILPVFWISLVILFAPAIVTYYMTGEPITMEYPYLKGFNFRDGIFMRNSLIALWLALSMYTAAFIAEVVRGGILAVSKGQTEAAFALGISPGRTMSLVVLPQALRVIFPPMISNYLNLTKNSSLAIAVGYMDITGTLGGITLNQTGREMETLLMLMACYLAISLTVSLILNWYNAKIKLRER